MDTDSETAVCSRNLIFFYSVLNWINMLDMDSNLVLHNKLAGVVVRENIDDSRILISTGIPYSVCKEQWENARM